MRVLTVLRCLCVALLAFGAFAIPSARHAQAAGSSTSCLPGVLRHRLAQIRAKFGRVSVISAYRRGARIAGTNHRSFHASCRAVDFAPPPGKYRAVVAWLKANHGGGIGTYSCAMHHIHIDNGPSIRFHHCVNASGVPIGRYASKSRSRRHASRRRGSSRRYASHRSGHRSGRRTAHRTTRARRSQRTASADGSEFKTRRFLRRLAQNGV